MNAALCLVPLLPLVASATIAVGLRRGARWLSTVSLAGSLGCAIAILVASARGETPEVAAPWLAIGRRSLTLVLRADPLAAVAAVLVSAVGVLVFLYALDYMRPDARAPRFYAAMSLFAGSMLVLVLAGDLIALFIAWELVGACSYLLIGFRLEDGRAGPAATKAFLVTRIGDLALLLGFLTLIARTGTSHMADLGSAVPTWVAFAIVLGAAAKSAQLPFQGWLPDAMVGPTPVSALLHSATMVAAGAFLLARFQAVLGPALPLAAWLGLATAMLGSAAALVEEDLKRTLAYSTMSQIGFMWIGIGSGSVLAGMVLLIGHALYKSTLFLAAGAVERGVGGTEFSRMGGLARRMPFTFAVSLLATLALAGVPITLALSPKDRVLAAARHASPLLFWLAIAASVLTAMYAGRILWLVFLRDREPSSADDARGSMRVALLAFGILLPIGLLADGRIVGSPLSKLIGATDSEQPVSTAVALVAAAAGFALAIAAGRRWSAYLIWPGFARLRRPLSAELGLVVVYRTIARGAEKLAALAATFDRRTFDAGGARLAHAVASFTRAATRIEGWLDSAATAAGPGMLRTARRASRIDRDWLEASISQAARLLLAGSERARSTESGRIENYLLYAIGGVLAACVAGAFALLLR